MEINSRQKKYNFFTASQDFLNIDAKKLNSLIESYIWNNYNVITPSGRNIGGRYNDRLLTAYYTISKGENDG